MGAVHLWVPDAQLDAARAELDVEVNWSALFQRALAVELARHRGDVHRCSHHELVCAGCGRARYVASA